MRILSVLNGLMTICCISNKYDSTDNLYHDEMNMDVDVKAKSSNKFLK